MTVQVSPRAPRATPQQPPPAPRGAMQVNPDLEALVCLRCGSRHPVGDLFEGCPRCSAEGHASSVVAAYRPAGGASRGARLPLLGAPTLGEGETPLIPLPWLAESLGLDSVALKAEFLNPTGSHKDRMSRLAAAWAAIHGWRRVIAASSGNAGVSLAAYAARTELACTILIKEQDTGGTWVREMARFGAEIEVLPTARGRWARQKELVERRVAFPVTNHVLPPVGSNPLGVQGYKEVGYELYRQTVGEVDLILVPHSRGDLLWGIWAGLREAAADNGAQDLPRMVAVEPFPRLSRVVSPPACQRTLGGADYRGTFPGTTRQRSIDGDTVTFQSLHTLRASGGWPVAVTDADALAAQRACRERGISLELCAAAAVAALRTLKADGRATAKTRAVLLGTSDGRHEPGRDRPSPKENNP